MHRTLTYIASHLFIYKYMIEFFFNLSLDQEKISLIKVKVLLGYIPN